MNYADWREPATQGFSCEYQPVDFSCDNSPLFTSEAFMLGLIQEDELIRTVGQYELINGVLKRHPSTDNLCSWDDHFGVSIASPTLAACVLDYLEGNGWELPNGNWIGRIPLLKPAVRAGAEQSLSLWDQIKTALVYFFSTFEKREETSGKMLLFFGRRVFQRHWLTRKATAYWTRKMGKLYADPAGMLLIYFPLKNGNVHPFVNAAPREWS